MIKNQKLSSEIASSTEAVSKLALFGPPPLLEGEDSAAYDELLVQVSGAVKPADILEEVWVRDVVDLIWETYRLRRLKANLLTARAYTGLNDILETFMEFDEAEDLAKRWAAQERAAIKKVDKILDAVGLTIDAVMAQTLSFNIDIFERIDRMIMGAEARRNVALRELDRHRASFSQALRQASQAVVDAQSEMIGAPQIEDRSAA
jgi:hypothetical protein